jgi:protein-(glutamine-N5) methyltransferase, release factor-specific
MKIKEALYACINNLKENNIDEAHSKARRLLAFTLNVPKEYLIINNEKELSKQDFEYYKNYITRLINGEPIQYIIGKQEFMGIEFNVNKDVLIPQPDTEILVEETIKIAKEYNKPKVLDLCTGSGAIAVSIKKYIPEAEVFASDISIKALQLAKINNIDNNINFIESNLFENINNEFDIIVSNPPYIRTEEIKSLSKEVQNEPLIALDGGQDGLDFYRDIIKQAHNYLKSNGKLCLEIGDEQKDAITQILKSNFNYTNIKYYKDLQGNDRVIIAEKM